MGKAQSFVNSWNSLNALQRAQGPGHTYPLPPAIKAPPSPNQRILLTHYANAKQKRAI